MDTKTRNGYTDYFEGDHHSVRTSASIMLHDLLELEQIINDENDPIERISELLDKGGFHHASEDYLRFLTLILFQKTLWEYIIEE